MKARTLHAWVIIILLGFISIIATSACQGLISSAPSGPTKPVVMINAPQTGASFTVGQPIILEFTAADVQGLTQVELIVDGQAIRIDPIDPPVNSYSATQPWIPQVTGSHVIEVRAYNVNNETSEPVQIFLTAVEAAGAETPPTLEVVLEPTPSPTPEPTPTATLVIPSEGDEALAASTESDEIEVSPAATEGVEPLVTIVADALFVRSGPGTNYPQIGRLVRNDTARIMGKDATGSWWQIVYPSVEDGRGWVSSNSQFTQATGAEGVPVAEAPPLPGSEPANTPTPEAGSQSEPTEPEPTPTEPAAPEPTTEPAPPTSLPTIHHFIADRYEIREGESVALSWDLSNARIALLRYDDEEEGVAAPGSKVVSPDTTTVYTLVARNDLGDVLAEVEIEVTSDNDDE